MTGEIRKFVREDLEDRGIDFNSADALGSEIQRGKNVTTAADADDSDVARRLHQVGGIDDVVLQVGELADIAIVPGDDRGRVRVDVETVLVYFHRRRMGKAPADRGALAKRRHPDAGIGVPALEKRPGLLNPLGPEYPQM